MITSGKAAILAMVVLAQGAVVAAQSGGARGGSDKDRLICRRMAETGSLAKSRRQCFTKAQWDRIAESQQEGARKTIDGLMTRPAGD